MGGQQPEMTITAARYRGRKLFMRISISAWVLVFVFGLLEFGARWSLFHLVTSEDMFQYFASPAQIAKKQKVTQFKFTDSPTFGVCLTPNYRHGNNRHNALGYRGDEITLPKPLGEFRIACMGGSTTYDDNIEDYRLAYPAVLERELRARGYPVTVVNAGVPVWTSRDTLASFCTRILDIGADMIIVYDAINDLAARTIWPPSLYDSQYSHMLVPITQALSKDAYTFSTAIRMAQLLLRGNPFVSRTPSGEETATLLLLLEQQVNGGTYPEGMLTRLSIPQALAANSPIYFSRNLENTIVLATHHSVTTVLMTFALNCEEMHLRQYPQALSEYAAGIDEMNGEIRTVARRTGAHLFDYANVMPKDGRYYADDMHSNTEGAALKAKLVADFLDANGLIPHHTDK